MVADRSRRQRALEIIREQGLHLFPFQLPPHGVSTWRDRHLQGLRGVMINLCELNRKE